MSPRTFVLSASLALLVAGAAQAQRPTPSRNRSESDSTKADTNTAPPVEKVSVTHHTINVNGKSVPYTATAGTMILRDTLGKPKATVFYIAYTRDQQDATNRPLTFFFNGGPGSASLWLDMGIMAPMHPDMGPGGAQPAPPYNLVPNPYTPLEATDLVQVDAMMTGYSRPAPGIKASEFTGDRNDIKMFGEFIRDYLDKNHRWASPKYLFGESYGTFRSAGLASELQDAEGVYLNGVMLLGTVLDFGFIAPSNTNDVGYASFLPTYAATAWYHKKLSPQLEGQPLEQVVQQAREFAFGEYLSALAKGSTLTPDQRQAMAQKVAGLTGVSPEFVMRSDLRIDPGVYRTELLRDRRLVVGRYDSRMTGPNTSPATTRDFFDPSDAAPSGAFVAGLMRYLHDDLNYSSDLQYYIGGHTGRWEYSNGGWSTASEVSSLQQAMVNDPYLHVMVGAGYYDMATPFGNAEYTFTHLGFDSTFTQRVDFKYYKSGHMAYLNQASAKQLQSDITSFIQSTAHPTAETEIKLEP